MFPSVERIAEVALAVMRALGPAAVEVILLLFVFFSAQLSISLVPGPFLVVIFFAHPEMAAGKLIRRFRRGMVLGGIVVAVASKLGCS